MTRLSIRRGCALLCGLALVTLAQPAVADWKRAESPRFIVYSDGGSDEAIRRYVQSLETYDYVLRARLGMSVDAPPARKLPIYLVSGRRGIAEINPETGLNVAGTYFPSSEDIFAAAIRDSGQDFLLHEYFHHFFYELGSTAHYPPWLVEGLAEYFMTAQITEESVLVGSYNENRAYWLVNGNWLDLDDLLSKSVGQVRREDRETYYPVAWLLTHWFMSDDGRQAQLTAYVNLVRTGGDPVTSIETATGLSLRAIQSQLRHYMRARMVGRRYEADFPQVDITITRLPKSANDLLLLGQRLKIGVPDGDRAATAEAVRRAAAHHPDDPFALLQLGHAELHFGDPEVGEAVLTRLLEREPDNVEALQLMASRYTALAEKSDDALPLLQRARGYLAHAYQVDDGNYYTLYMLARIRQSQPSYPNDNDMATWELAFGLAPQLPGIRLGYGSALMSKKRYEEAITLLEPLANAPHAGAAGAARTLIELARQQQAPLDRAVLDAAAEQDARPEPETPATPPSDDGASAGSPADAGPAETTAGPAGPANPA